jgi:MOSC domain-containing protein YiiM
MKTSLKQHLSALGEILQPPKETGKLLGLVLRPERGTRSRQNTLHLTPEDGILGDRWGKVRHKKRDRQVSAMRLDVLQTLAGNQDTALSGDNLLVDLDLSEANLPAGSRIKIGEVLFQISPQQHLPCEQFVARFGQAAHDAVLEPKWLALRGRGVLLEVIEGGAIHLGDPIRVIRQRVS